VSSARVTVGTLHCASNPVVSKLGSSDVHTAQLHSIAACIADRLVATAAAVATITSAAQLLQEISEEYNIPIDFRYRDIPLPAPTKKGKTYRYKVRSAL
jgi:hypothetical protein